VWEEWSTYYFSTYWRPVHRGSLINRLTGLVSAVLLLGQVFCSTGCGGAPSVTIAGAYFPAWLLCAVIAVVVAALIRALMVATRLANHIPYQLVVCCSAGAIVALILWHFWVAH
jgi:YtcA family